MENEDLYGPARNLRLFLAKSEDGTATSEDGKWLKDDDPAAQHLSEGKRHTHIQQVIIGEQAVATRAL